MLGASHLVHGAKTRCASLFCVVRCLVKNRVAMRSVTDSDEFQKYMNKIPNNLQNFNKKHGAKYVQQLLRNDQYFIKLEKWLEVFLPIVKLMRAADANS